MPRHRLAYVYVAQFCGSWKLDGVLRDFSTDFGQDVYYISIYVYMWFCFIVFTMVFIMCELIHLIDD